MYLCMIITYSKSDGQPGKVAYPTHGQLNRENDHFPVPVRAWSRETVSAVPSRVSLVILYTQAESGAYGVPPNFRGGAHLFI